MTPIRRGIPRVPGGLIPRPELAARLSAEARLVVVRGPAGSGKSAFVAAWLGETSDVGDVLWVTRTADVTDRISFWEAVLEELARFGFASGGMSDQLEGTDVRAAVLRTVSTIGRPLVVVLDNFGPPGADWDETVADIVACLVASAELRVVVIGRERTALEDPGMPRGIEVVAIGPDALRLGPDAARRLADAHGLAHLADEEIEGMREAVRGLVFPLRYAFEATVRARREARTADDWADRLANDMLARVQDPEFAERAGAIAQAPYASADLVGELLGVEARTADEVLAAMSRPGIGDRDVDGIFRFTERARNALGSRYRAARPAAAAAAAVVAARWLRERGAGLEAIEHALRGGDLDLAMDVIVEHLLDLLPRDVERIFGVVDGIEQARIAEHPSLAAALGTLAIGRIRGRGPRAEAYALLVRTGRVALEQEHGPGRRLLLWTALAIALWALGRFAESLEAVRSALAADDDLTGRERIWLGATYPLLLGQLGRAAFDAGAGELAADCFQRELAASPTGRFPRRRNVALGDLAMLLAYAGRMHEAEALLASVDPAGWSGERRDVRPSTSWRLASAYVAMNRGDFDGAIRLLEGYQEPRAAAVDNWALVAVARAIAMTLGGAARAAELGFARARAAHADPAGRAAAAAAGVDAMLELVQLVRGGRVLPPRQAGEPEPVGRGAGITHATRAIRAAAADRMALAEQHLAKARRAPGSLRSAIYTAMAGVIIAARGGGPGAEAELRTCAAAIAGIVATDGLAWPLAMLGTADRAAVLDVLVGSPHAAALRLAFDRIPPLVSISRDVVELHPRELAVLRELVTTSSRTELAARGFVSVNTVKSQLRSIYRKLGVGDRESALLRAAELGLLEPPEHPPR